MDGDLMGINQDTRKYFDIDHVYYQWLNFRKPFPVSSTKS